MLYVLEKRVFELMFFFGWKLKKNVKRIDFFIEMLKLGNVDCS